VAELHKTGSHYEEHEPTASDEDSDSDDANTSRRRDRFRTERGTSDSTTLLQTPVNKAEKRDIPDTLGETYWLHLTNTSMLHLFIPVFHIFAVCHLNLFLISMYV